MAEICRTVEQLRNVQARLRSAGQTSALVPTMGALHSGHLALVDHAGSLADRVIATIFVNPTQFAPGEDLDRYPRQEEQDMAALQDAGVEAVFIPKPDEMYGANDATRLVMEGPALGLEADFRPHFFNGVATIVSRLLLAAMSDVAVFGEKDYQQLLVIKRMVEDLKIPVAIHGSPTIREADGLALSSRNTYLSEDERQAAPELQRSLITCKESILGDVPTAQALRTARGHLEEAGFRPDYVELRDAQTLKSLDGDWAERPARLLAAAWLGNTRLIDNIALELTS